MGAVITTNNNFIGGLLEAAIIGILAAVLAGILSTFIGLILGLIGYGFGYVIAARLAAYLPNVTTPIAGAHTTNNKVREGEERVTVITVFRVAVLSIEKCFNFCFFLFTFSCLLCNNFINLSHNRQIW